MGIWKNRKDVKPSDHAKERTAEAHRQLQEQKAKMPHAEQVQASIVEALRKNHLAQLMYDALEANKNG